MSEDDIEEPFIEPPMINCLILCDDVLMSASRGKHTLQGVIGTIVVKQIPIVLRGLVAYLRMSNVYPKSKLHFSLIRASDNEQILAFDGDASQGADPLGIVTAIMRLPPIRITAAGRYNLMAEHSGNIIACTPLRIKYNGAERDAENA